MNDAAVRRVAWVLGAVSFATLAAGSILEVATGTLSDQSETPPALDVAFALAMATFTLTGLVIASRQPGNLIGRLFIVFGLLVGVSTLAGAYGDADPPLPGRAWGAWMSSWSVVALPILVQVMLLFPDGRLLSRRWLAAAWVNAAAALTVFVGLTFAPGPIEGQADVMNPLGVDAIGHPLLEKGGVGWALIPIAVLAAAASLVLRYRRSGGIERQQIKWFAFAAAVVALGYIASAVTYDTALQQALGIIIASQLGVAALPVATAVAILKYRLYDIDVVINKTVVYGALALFITAVYVSIVVGLGVLIGRGDEPNVALSIAATAVVAVAFQPVRERVQRFANRLVYGDRASPYDVLARFSERVAGTYATEDVLPRTARVIAEGTGAARAEVWLRIDRELVISAAWPDEVEGDRRVALANGELPTFDGTDRVLPVRHMDEMLGAVTVTKPRGERLTPAEERLLADLASQAGSVLRSVGLTAELQARLEQISAQAGELRVSRQRIVAAHDAERRRLERNIHDGAQQHLVALAVKLRLAKSIAAKDPEKARRMLEGLQGETMEALDTLTDLSRGIYPAVLEEHGIAAALEAQAARSTLPIGLEVDGMGRYPIEAEAAVYFCCLEALQNASKYADAASVEVRIAESGDDLVFSVTDDGSGFDPATSGDGSGLQNMRDRAAAIGGGVEITSIPGRGTTVTGRIPARTREPAR